MIYRFEICALDVERRELSFGGEIRHLEPQVFDLLLYLVENRDRVINKDEILKALGGNRFVSDALITTRLAAARSAIGDTGNEQRLIKTFRRKGLRFVGAVREYKATSSRKTSPSTRLRGRVADQLSYAALTGIGLLSGREFSLGGRLLDEAENAIIIGLSSLI